MAQVSSLKLPQVLWGLSLIVVVGAIVAGLVVTGGPQVQRMKEMDRIRVSDLGELERYIQTYLEQEERLPERLIEVKAYLEDYQSFPVDPVTKKSYEYRKKDDTHFMLCAVFQRENKSSRANATGSYGSYYANRTHNKGQQCYTYKANQSEDSRTGYRFSVKREFGD